MSATKESASNVMIADLPIFAYEKTFAFLQVILMQAWFALKCKSFQTIPPLSRTSFSEGSLELGRRASRYEGSDAGQIDILSKSPRALKPRPRSHRTLAGKLPLAGTTRSGRENGLPLTLSQGSGSPEPQRSCTRMHGWLHAHMQTDVAAPPLVISSVSVNIVWA